MDVRHMWSDENKRSIILAGAGLGGLFLAYKLHVICEKAGRRKKWASAGKDIVILHQLPRARFTPSMSPFPIKLETYLRMCGITYQNDFTEPFGPKGKTPWITLNGEDTADSQLCLQLLARKFNKNLSHHLSLAEHGTAKAIQVMVDEHMLWVLVMWRFIYKKCEDLNTIQPGLPLMVRFIGIPAAADRWKRFAYGQGIGRHSQADVIEMGVQDLRALSQILGTKQFLMGDKATEVDCSAFGMLCQFLYNTPGSPFENLLNGELINLKNYVLRMKETFWPDWNRCLSIYRRYDSTA